MIDFDYQKAIQVKLSDELPPKAEFDPSKRRAPDRGLNLSKTEIKIALKNALRYIPEHLHEEIAPEF